MKPKKKPEPAAPPRHTIAARSLIVIRCVCGWFHRIEQIRGKTDDDLIMEVEQVYLEHARKMELEGY